MCVSTFVYLCGVAELINFSLGINQGKKKLGGAKFNLLFCFRAKNLIFQRGIQKQKNLAAPLVLPLDAV